MTLLNRDQSLPPASAPDAARSVPLSLSPDLEIHARPWCTGPTEDRDTVGTLPAIVSLDPSGRPVPPNHPGSTRAQVMLCYDPSFAALYLKTRTWITDTALPIPADCLLAILTG